MNTGFRIDVSYNEATDVLTFSPNGDYVRVKPQPGLSLIHICLASDHAAQALIGVSRVHQYHMCALLIILAHEVVHDERLAAARRTQHELVAVGRDTSLHGQVGDVKMCIRDRSMKPSNTRHSSAGMSFAFTSDTDFGGMQPLKYRLLTS